MLLRQEYLCALHYKVGYALHYCADSLNGVLCLAAKRWLFWLYGAGNGDPIAVPSAIPTAAVLIADVECLDIFYSAFREYFMNIICETAMLYASEIKSS